MLTSEDDPGNIQKSMAMYDALYAYCRAQILLREDPSLARLPFFERNQRIKAALSRKSPYTKQVDVNYRVGGSAQTLVRHAAYFSVSPRAAEK